MGKRSRKQTQWRGKSKLGCMWSWISMFDVGHGRGNQKLLSDKRCKAPDVGAPEKKLKMLKDVERIGQLSEGGIAGGKPMTDANKQSVKKLIEEEMVTESTKRNKIALSGSELGTLVRRNQKKATKMYKTSSQIDLPDKNIIEKLGSDDSVSDLYIEVIMQDIFSHIQEKSISWSKNQPGEPLQSEQKLSLLEERISEATKRIMHQKFLNGEDLTEARKVQYYNKYMDTLEMLDTNKEFFLKLSEDPNSSLMKQFKKMPSSNSIQKPRSSLRLSEENGSDLQYTITGKELRLQNGCEDNNSKKSEHSNKIVILKPEKTELRASATEGGPVLRYNAAYQFSLSEIRNKLKLAVQKDRLGTSFDVVSMSPYKFQKQRLTDTAFVKDNLGMQSPGRNHFYVEKIPRPSSESKLVEKIKNKNDASAKQRVSSIYTEAKRHLSELLSKGDEDEGLPSKHSSKTLERFLSVPEINISHCRIPSRHSFDHTITGGKFSTHAEAQPCNKNSQETELVNQAGLNDLWSPTSENDFCAFDDNAASVSESFNTISENGKETLLEDKELATTADFLNTTSKGIMKDMETTDPQPETAGSAPDAICESVNSVVNSDDQNSCSEEVDEVEACSENNEQDTREEYVASSISPLVHPFFTAISIDTDDLASPADKSERPSPISILEYVFSEDEFSPAGTESYLGSVEPRRLRPIRIRFGEDELSTTSRDAYKHGCVDNCEISFQFIEAVLSSTYLCWEELYMTSLISSQLLDEAVFDEVEEQLSQLPYNDRRLLFDCINEILYSMCQRYFGGCPLISFLKLNIRPVPKPHNAVQEVWEGVEWHLLPPPHPQSLEQIVRKYLERDTVWMDLKFDVEELSIEMETTILQELMEEAVLSCIEVLVR